MKRGGALLVLEKSGNWNGEKRRRIDNPFAEFFATSAFRHDQMEETANFDPNQQFAAKGRTGRPMVNQYGKGRVAYLPAIDYVHAAKSLSGGLYNKKYSGCDSRYWELPRNWDEIQAILEWLAPKLQPFKLFGAEHIYLDYTQLADRRLAVPFFRLNAEEAATLPFVWNQSQEPKRPYLYLPHQNQPLALQPSRYGGRWETVLNNVLGHGVVVWQ